MVIRAGCWKNSRSRRCIFVGQESQPGPVVLVKISARLHHQAEPHRNESSGFQRLRLEARKNSGNPLLIQLVGQPTATATACVRGNPAMRDYSGIIWGVACLTRISFVIGGLY